jgi:hypothetical protein
MQTDGTTIAGKVVVITGASSDSAKRRLDPCNVCLSPPMVSAIVRMKPDGSGMESFTEGRAQQRRVRLARRRRTGRNQVSYRPPG